MSGFRNVFCDDCSHSKMVHDDYYGSCEVPRCKCRKFILKQKRYRFQLPNDGSIGRIYNKKEAERKELGIKTTYERV